ncbi:MAG: methyl-accepting chemotaxis protein [Deltaproteobacteria bacterium]
MNWTIGKKLGGLCLTMIVVLIAFGAFSYRNITKSIENSELVRHTFGIIDESGEIPDFLWECESASRGLFLTGNQLYYQEYQEARNGLLKSLEGTKKLVRNEKASQILTHLESLINTRIKAFDEVHQSYREKQMAGPIEYIKGGKPITLSKEIVKVHADLDQLERSLLKAHEKELEASNANLRNLILFGVPLSILLIGGISYLLIRSITLPLGQLTSVAESISQGNLSQRLDCTGRSDEIAVLSNAFERMSDYLKSMSQVAHSLASQDLTVSCAPKSEQDSLGNAFVAMISNLRGVAKDIQDAALLISGSTTQIVSLTAQLAASSTETAAAVNETTTTIEEIKVTAQLVNQKSALVSESARDTADMTASGRKSVNDTVQGMTKIRQQMDFIAESIVKLSEQSMAIGEIISTVSDLTGQSNLLAVNASIEAAKAGEQGKGFAVVAQEMRSLAEQSKGATEQVRRILNEIQKAISSAVMATEQGGKTVETSVRQTADTEPSIHAIEHGAAVTAQASAQILASTNEQVAGLNQVAAAMDNVRNASDQIVISIRQADESVSSLDELGKKLWRLVERLKVT